METPKKGDRRLGGKSGKPIVFDGQAWVYEDEASAAPTAAAPEPAPVKAKPPRHARGLVDVEAPGRNARETAKELGQQTADAAVGVGTGLSMGFDDEVMGALGVEDYQRTKDEAAARSAHMADRVGENMPSANTMGEVAGSLVLPGGPAKAGAGRMANLARNSMVQGAVTGAGSSNDDRVFGAVTGAGAGILGGAVSKAVKGVGRLASGQTARVARAGADNARVRAVGLNPAMVSQEPGGVARQAATQRKYGIGKGLLDSTATQQDQAQRAIDAAEAERAALRPADRIAGVNVGRNVAKRAQALAHIDEPYKRGLIKKANDLANSPPMDMDTLAKGRKHYSPSSWAGDSNRADKELAGAFGDAEEALIERNTPGGGARYKELGQDEAGLIRARQGLLGEGGGARSAGIPYSKVDAANRLMPRKMFSNIGAHGREALATGTEGVRDAVAAARPGAARTGGVDTAMLEGANEGGEELGRQIGMEGARDLNQEDPYEYYRQYMSDPNYRYAQ